MSSIVSTLLGWLALAVILGVVVLAMADPPPSHVSSQPSDAAPH